jgi:glycosyltransferase involved in cell wall biosynthesis
MRRMRVLVATEYRFDRTPDGAVWSIGLQNYEFWTRYLDVFERVAVLARVRPVPEKPRGAVRTDGPNVSLIDAPYYVGTWGFLRKYPSIRLAVRGASTGESAVILRAPGAIATLLAAELESDRPFGIEVLGDPWDSLAPGSVRTVLRPLLRKWLSRRLRVECARACAAAYVNAESLQRRYPAPSSSYVTNYSSITLDDRGYVQRPREWPSITGPRKVAFVGSLEYLSKAPDVLIDAIARARDRGTILHLTIAGDGRHRRELEERTAHHQLESQVRFLGHVANGDAIRRVLDASELFVIPSRADGLPRALIEAMARALPCIGSNVGGIPELLGMDEQVAPEDADALALKMIELSSDTARLRRLSRENLEKARAYHIDVLRPRRQMFLRTVRDATLRWHRMRRTA